MFHLQVTKSSLTSAMLKTYLPVEIGEFPKIEILFENKEKKDIHKFISFIIMYKIATKMRFMFCNLTLHAPLCL